MNALVSEIKLPLDTYMTVVNDDGTEFNPPMLPEYNALIDKYICKSGFDYGCMYCNRCPLGDYFNPTDDEQDIIQKQKALYNQYIIDHNPSLR